MSVRDAQQTLPLALASVQAQTVTDWELLIADDGSTDESPAIVAAAASLDSRIRMVGDRFALGLSDRLNQLAGAARAPLIARMDADDVCYPERLEQQMAFLDAHPGIDLLGTSMVVFGGDGRGLAQRLAPPRHADICHRVTRGFPLFHPTWMARTEWLCRHPYCARAARCEDQDLLFRSYRTSRFANLSQPLLGYREDRLVLGNLLRGRRSMAMRFGGRLWRERHPLLAARVIVEQLTKGGVDAAMITLGFEQRLVRRSSELPPGEAIRWRRVWDSLQSAPHGRLKRDSPCS
jgi:glycosyltransferase involved in cell wall biosynthesis